MRLFHLPLNLQQGLIHTGKEDVSNTVCAFYSKHKNAICIRPEYRDMEAQIVVFTYGILPEAPTVIYGDAFGVDTWDQRMHKL